MTSEVRASSKHLTQGCDKGFDFVVPDAKVGVRPIQLENERDTPCTDSPELEQVVGPMNVSTPVLGTRMKEESGRRPAHRPEAHDASGRRTLEFCGDQLGDLA
jgi:hypothetical protein